LYEYQNYPQFNVTKLFGNGKEKREFLYVAHVWVGGTRATSFLFCLLVFEFVRQKFRPSKRGRGGRGVWGEFRLARAEAKPRHPAHSEQTDKEKFCFPFRRKNQARANKKL